MNNIYLKTISLVLAVFICSGVWASSSNSIAERDYRTEWSQLHVKKSANMRQRDVTPINNFISNISQDISFLKKELSLTSNENESLNTTVNGLLNDSWHGREGGYMSEKSSSSVKKHLFDLLVEYFRLIDLRRANTSNQDNSLFHENDQTIGGFSPISNHQNESIGDLDSDIDLDNLPSFNLDQIEEDDNGELDQNAQIIALQKQIKSNSRRNKLILAGVGIGTAALVVWYFWKGDVSTAAETVQSLAPTCPPTVECLPVVKTVIKNVYPTSIDFFLNGASETFTRASNNA